MMYGVGFCDEWFYVDYSGMGYEDVFDYEFEVGMMFCVEVLVSFEGGDFLIKLEDQVLIIEDGYENLMKYLFDLVLMGEI